MLKPFPFLPLNELTREAVKSYVDAQKALMEVMVKPANRAENGRARAAARSDGEEPQSGSCRRLKQTVDHRDPVRSGMDVRCKSRTCLTANPE